jgi:hypothetical protein
MRRKHISWKTKYASALLALDDIPYIHATKMAEDHIISLYHIDHNILHETGHPDRNKFWNLTPRLIAEHRAKTKRDVKIVAKGRRIRGGKLLSEWLKLPAAVAVVEGIKQHKRKLRSRGFDKTRRRKMDGTVAKR